MQTRFYIGVAGCEADIKGLHERLAIPGSEVFQMKGVNREIWKWCSESQPRRAQFAEDDLLKYLSDNRERLSLLKEYPRLHDLTAQIVSRREGDGDTPHGYHLPKEAIQLIGELGAALDIDVIWYE